MSLINYVTLVWIAVMGLQVLMIANLSPLKDSDETIFANCFWLVASLLAFIAYNVMLIQAATIN